MDTERVRERERVLYRTSTSTGLKVFAMPSVLSYWGSKSIKEANSGSNSPQIVPTRAVLGIRV